MTKAELKSLSLAELKDLRKDVAKAIETYEERQRKEARAALESKAKEMGFTLDELVGRPRGRRAAGIPKYAHPENPQLTWTGKGRQPKWFKEALAAGKSPDEMALS